MATTSSVLCTAQASYKKQPGTLTLSHDSFAFLAQGQAAPSLTIPTSAMTALFASKPGGPRVMLKIQFKPVPPSSEDSHNFTFASPTSALNDRERFKQELSDAIARNREQEAALASQQAQAASAAGDPKGKGKERAVDSPTPGPGARTPGTPGGAGGTPGPRGAPSQATTFQLRKQVLQSNPQLLALHRELVLSSQITEAEFWEGREDLVAAVAAEQGLVKGKSGEMVDPKTVTGQNGEVTVKITPALIREIFEEFPVVLRAYNDNVPDPLDEAAFWTRYFQSKLFNRNRTTNRAAVDAIKDDPIFDQYLGVEDDGIEPQHMHDHEIYRLLDLAATEEDQHEITNLPRDYTMKPGGQRASLPLMRRFNEHSERLLNQALGSTADRGRTFLDPGHAGDRRYYNEIELSDLSRARTEDRIALTLADRTNLASSSGAGGSAASLEGEGEAGGGSVEEGWRRKEAVRRTVEGVRDEWEGRLAEFGVDAAAVRDGMRDMTSSIEQQAERTRKTVGGSASSTGGLPRAHLTTVSSLSTTTFEFLRHFWSALLPPKPNDLSSLALLAPADRAARVDKFRAYLEKSRERVARAVEDARAEGDEVGRRVGAALGPVDEAIEAALKTYRQRMGGGA
ncbi:TFIIH/NER complex subunit TFB1 [Rhodotorula paludigena]|uniref:TFIIH/NER complex subunit TFB1 n=1 Tax=Rhodotorula paludigena TaxID=86838 RepID=UPI0031717B0A